MIIIIDVKLSSLICIIFKILVYFLIFHVFKLKRIFTILEDPQSLSLPGSVGTSFLSYTSLMQ